MKTKINQYIFYIGLFNFILLASCSKDEEPIQAPNQMVFDGQTIQLKHGYITHYNHTDNHYIIWLTSPNLTMDLVTGKLLGNGDVIRLDFFPSSVDLVNGKFEIDGVYNAGNSLAVLWKNYDANLLEYDIYFASSGTILIAKSGSKHKISFSITFEIYGGGKETEVSGSFVGLLEQFI